MLRIAWRRAFVRHTPAARPSTWIRCINQQADSKVFFSGIQPTGVPHLGNYLGAISQWTRLQRESPPSSKLYFAIVDLHSLTSPLQSPSERSLSRRQTLAILLAAGLDPARCVLFYQSAVPQHAELHWILSCDASVGALARMPTWKEKMVDARPESTDSSEASLLRGAGKENEERLKLGLFSYPVLQAADILLYDTTHVPVGADQLVHIEFARSAANIFNHKFASKDARVLVSPEPVVGQARRIMSLTEPSKKMSKSATNARSRILITDSDAEIRKKFRAALTDSGDGITYDVEARPGVANLLEVIALLESKQLSTMRQAGDIAKEFQEMSADGSIMRVLKERAADLVCNELGPVRDAFLTLVNDAAHLDSVAEQGRLKASQHAAQTMTRVRQAIGLE